MFFIHIFQPTPTRINEGGLYQKVQELTNQLKAKENLIREFEGLSNRTWQHTIDELREQKQNAEQYAKKLESQLCEQMKDLDSLTKVNYLNNYING